MSIRFLKQHDIYNAGEIVDLPDGLANYLIRVGAAELHSDHVQEMLDDIPSLVDYLQNRMLKEKVVRKHSPEKAQIIKPPSKKRIKKPGS